MVPHTVIVDFAVALLITSVFSDALAILGEEDEFRTVGYWTLVFGAVAAALAAISGYAAYDAAAPTGEAESVVLTHRNLGLATLACFLPLGLWRLLRHGHYPDRLAALYWTLTLIGGGLLIVTALYGGTAVFRHGVGVELIR